MTQRQLQSPDDGSGRPLSRCCARSAAAGWLRSISPMIRSTIVRSRSRCSPRKLAEALGRLGFCASGAHRRLTHPHILPLFDSGEADGLLFYVMPFVDGRDAARAPRPRRASLPLEEAVRHRAAEWPMALALRTARGSCIATSSRRTCCCRRARPRRRLRHRARLPALPGRGSDADRAWSIGTPSYMSPEQAVGDSSASTAGATSTPLRCLLFELLTGCAALHGRRRRGRRAAAAHRSGAASPHVRVRIPAAIDEAVAKALARDPADRFATAEAFAAALKRRPP